jgi:excisionase family DNA binding protein
MTEPGPQAAREWISTTRPCTEHPDPPTVDVSIINGVPRVGPPWPPRTFDPIHILGCSREEAVELFRGRPVTPGEAEAIAAGSYPWRRHLDDPESYWITTTEAARILEVTPREVTRLLDRGRLRHVRHASRVRLMRRDDIVAVAEARQ